MLTFGLAVLAIIVFAACQAEPETVEVIVTRVVTEIVESVIAMAKPGVSWAVIFSRIS